MTAKPPVSTLAFALPMWIWIAAIFAVSSIPGPALTAVGISVWDKLAHFLEYGVLGFLALRRERWGFSRQPSDSFVRATLLSGAVAGLDECYQFLIPGRTTDLADWLADLLGVCVGASLALVFSRRQAAGRLAQAGRSDEGV